MIRSPLNFQRCNGCRFEIEGTLKISEDLHYWEGRSAFLVLPNITGAVFTSRTGSGLIDGSGQIYWDYFAKNNTYRRPLLIQMSHASHVLFTHLQVRNAPFWFFSMTDGSTNITFSELVLSAVSTSSNPAHNTDGFDTGDSSYITIRDSHVTNGDDCVSFKNGSNFITVLNLTCVGSHGLSVGSLGSEPGRSYIVQNIYVSNTRMINCTLATRIKFYPGGPSYGTVLVKNVTYENIVVENSDYALQIDNCYESNPAICKKNPATAQLVDVRFRNITGTTSSKYDPVVARIDCPPDGSCHLSFVGWDVKAPSGTGTVLCSHYDHPLGVTCTPEFH